MCSVVLLACFHTKKWNVFLIWQILNGWYHDDAPLILVLDKIELVRVLYLYTYQQSVLLRDIVVPNIHGRRNTTSAVPIIFVLGFCYSIKRFSFWIHDVCIAYERTNCSSIMGARISRKEKKEIPCDRWLCNLEGKAAGNCEVLDLKRASVSLCFCFTCPL